MSSITDPVTFLELQLDFLSRTGQVNNAPNLELAKRLLNIGLVNVHLDNRYQFPWAERMGTIVTHAPYTTGTISITTTTSRTAVTGSSTLWNTAVSGFSFNNARAGGKIKPGAGLEIYTVATVTSDTYLTLNSTYVGDDLSGESYTYFEDEASLASDFLRLVDLKMFSTAMNIELVGRTDFRRGVGRNDLFSKPKFATQIQLTFSGSTAPQHRVVFHPVPDNEYQIPYWYVTNKLAVSTAGVESTRMNADTDEPIIPVGKRQAITLHAIYEYYRDYKDDLARAGTAEGKLNEYLSRVFGDASDTNSRPRFVVRGRAGYRNDQRFDYGNRFDELRDRWRR